MSTVQFAKWFTRQRVLSISINTVACIWFMSFPLLFLGGDQVSSKHILSFWQYWFFCGSFIGLYYLHAYLWLPVATKQRMYLLYAIGVLLMSIVFSWGLKPFGRLMDIRRDMQQNSLRTDTTRPFDSPPPPSAQRHGPPPHMRGDRPPPPEMGPRNMTQHWDIATIYIYLMVISLGAMVRIIQYWIQSQKRVAEVEHERIKTELSFLKAQVHPHFLFNTLNNIYALALTQDPKTPDSLHKLSQLMRYFMDENHGNTVPLKREVQAIQDYISLQKLRLGNNCEIIETYKGLDIPKTIAPFILMPFVENAFKYGISNQEDSLLLFDLHAQEQSIIFKVINTVHDTELNQERSGIGLKNTQRRLEHIYPKKFELAADCHNNQFVAILTLHI